MYYNSTVSSSFSVCSCVSLRSLLFFRFRQFGSQSVIPLLPSNRRPSRIECRAANWRIVVGHLGGIEGVVVVVLCCTIRSEQGSTRRCFHAMVGRVNRAPKPDQYGRWTLSIAAGCAIMVRTIFRNYRRMQFRRVALGNLIVLLHIASMTES